MGPIEIVDDDDFEYVMVVAKSLRGSIKLYIIKSLIERKDNQQAEDI